MLEYPNIKSGDTMSKNKEILNNWKNELEKRNTLNLEQAQSLYKEIIECEDNKLKKLIASVGDTFLRNKLNEEYLMYRSQNNGTEKIQAERIAELESANTELLKQQRLEHEEKANNKIEAEKILKKLDNLNDNEEKNMEVTKTKKKPMDDLADVIREFMQRFID